MKMCALTPPSAGFDAGSGKCTLCLIDIESGQPQEAGAGYPVSTEPRLVLDAVRFRQYLLIECGDRHPFGARVGPFVQRSMCHRRMVFAELGISGSGDRIARSQETKICARADALNHRLVRRQDKTSLTDTDDLGGVQTDHYRRLASNGR